MEYYGLQRVTFWSWFDIEIRLRSRIERLTACDHCILRSLIGPKDRDYSSSLHTRKRRSKGSNKSSWMKIHTWVPTWQTINNVSWSTGTCIKPHLLTSWRKFQHTMSVKHMVRPLDDRKYMVKTLGSCEVALSLFKILWRWIGNKPIEGRFSYVGCIRSTLLVYNNSLGTVILVVVDNTNLTCFFRPNFLL